MQLQNENEGYMEHRLAKLEAALPLIADYQERLSALERQGVKIDVVLERICSDVAEIKKDFKHLNKSIYEGEGAITRDKIVWELMRLLGITIAIIGSVVGLRQFI